MTDYKKLNQLKRTFGDLKKCSLNLKIRFKIKIVTAIHQLNGHPVYHM